jgi:hypothetical protein
MAAFHLIIYGRFWVITEVGTPVVGTLIAVIEVWVTITQPRDPWISIALATLGATAAMIGPGAWSLDARLFGRKHVAL